MTEMTTGEPSATTDGNETVAESKSGILTNQIHKLSENGLWHVGKTSCGKWFVDRVASPRFLIMGNSEEEVNNMAAIAISNHCQGIIS